MDLKSFSVWEMEKEKFGQRKLMIKLMMKKRIICSLHLKSLYIFIYSLSYPF